MIANKNWYVIPGSLGLLAIFCGLLFYPYNRMTDDDFRVAFSKFVKIPLESLTTSGGYTGKFDIPNDKQWMHIREKWHDPRYVIAIDSAPVEQRHKTISLDDVGIQVAIYKAGTAVELKPSWPPYGYSSTSQSCCLEFRANPGDELKISVTALKQPFQPPAQAELFVISDWPNTKDLIVGVDISNRLLFPICRGVIGFGFLLVVIAVLVRLLAGKGANPEIRPPTVGPWHGLL